MIPQWLIAAVDATGALALLACLVLVLARGRWLPGPARLLLGLIAVLTAMQSTSNFTEWSGILPQADFTETIVSPLLPTLWLFLFVVALERADREQLRRSFDRMAGVQELALKLTVSLEPRAVMDEVVHVAGRLLGAPFAVIFTPNASGDRLVAQAFRGPSPQEADVLSARTRESLGSRAFIDRRPFRTNRPADDLGTAVMPVIQTLGITDLVSIPLLFQGEAVGVLSVGRRHSQAFTDGEVRLLETFCAHAAVAIENARLYERIAESEAKYRVLVENAQAGIVVVDASRHITFWNRGAEALFGWADDEVLGKHIELVYPEDRRGEVVQKILPVLQRERTWSGEFPLVRKDGSPFTAFLSLSHIEGPGGSISGTLGILADVTERVQLREQLCQAQKMETVGELAGGVAHDFNNLLTAVLGFSGILRTSLPKDGETAEAVASIEEAAERGTQLVRQLMAFSHKQPTRQEPVNLNDVVRETGELMSRTFPKSTVLKTRLQPDLYLVQADPTQMHQVIMNLMVNARDAMAGGGTITITTANLVLDAGDPLAEGLTVGPCVVLTVSDTGSGIPLDAQPHIFEPFFTTKRESGGTGLGLSTTYAIVARHGGRISFTSRPGEGTAFRVILPAARTGSAAPGLAAGSTRPTTTG